MINNIVLQNTQIKNYPKSNSSCQGINALKTSSYKSVSLMDYKTSASLRSKISFGKITNLELPKMINGEVVVGTLNLQKRVKDSFLKKSMGEVSHFEDFYVTKSVGRKKSVYPYETAHTANNFTSYTLYAKDNQPLGFTSINTDSSGAYLLVNDLYTNNNGKNKSEYKGIGTELIKLAIKESQKRYYHGKVRLHSLDDAMPFYYKLGFRFERKFDNMALERYLSGPQTSKPFASDSYMYLGTESAEKLLKE